jgi:1,4-alpha-glucan branching enzyme
MKGLAQAAIAVLLLSGLLSCREEAPLNPLPPGPETYVPEPDPPAYGSPFEERAANRDLVMYEVNIRAFSPQGRLQGVTARLDSIRALGVNTIWLMPIYPIGQERSVNSPYAIRDFNAVGAEYGDLDDLRELVDAAHERGMAVILDWVANHTAWDNPWMERPEWYTQVNGQVVHPPGTNWMDVADLNFDHPDMPLAMISAMKYWVLAANVDGYRCDAADFVPFSFWKRAIDTLRAMPGRDLILLAEGARSDHFSAGFDLNFSWSFYDRLKTVFGGANAAGLISTHRTEYNSLSPDKEKLRFSTNHDESAWDATPVELFGGLDGAFAAQALVTVLGGVPLIYGSQEVGRAEPLPFFSRSPIDWSANPELLTRYRRLMAAYASSEALRARELSETADPNAVFFHKSAAGQEALVLVNVRDTALNWTLPEAWRGTVWQERMSLQSDTLPEQIGLEGYGVRIWVKP